MVQLISGVLLAASPLAIGEVIVQRFGLQMELARKLIHVLASLATACLALFLPLDQIAWIGIVFTFVLLAVRRRKLVTAIYQVDRQSYGELFFPAGVAAAAWLAPDVRVYVVAMAIVGISDTAASIIGGKFGSRKWPGVATTFAGSGAFLLTALAILLVSGTGAMVAVSIAALLTLIEAYSVFGSDNITVAVGTVLMLARFVS